MIMISEKLWLLTAGNDRNERAKNGTDGPGEVVVRGYGIIRKLF